MKINLYLDPHHSQYKIENQDLRKSDDWSEYLAVNLTKGLGSKGNQSGSRNSSTALTPRRNIRDMKTKSKPYERSLSK